MAVNTIEVPNSLREVVDGFILNNPSVEYGGFLFGTKLRFDTFLPIPNVAANKNTTYKMPDSWPQYSKAFSNVVGVEAVAHVHTHPSHSIPSEQDFRSMEYWFRYVEYMVLVVPDVEGAKTTWWVLDKNAEVQDIVATDKELEASSLLFARRYGFVNLGEVLMDRDGGLSTRGGVPEALISEADVRVLYTRAVQHKGRIDTKKHLLSISGLTMPRLTKALGVLEKAGLVDIPKNSWNSYVFTDLFGRSLR